MAAAKNNPASNNPRRLTPKKVLDHPLVWLALGLHVLWLLVPFNPNAPTLDDPKPQEEETIEEAIAVDILNLSKIAASAPPPAETRSPAVPPAPVAPPLVAPSRTAACPGCAHSNTG